MLRDELRVWQVDLEGAGQWVITITPTVAALSALLTATGTRDRSKIVTISWNLLWIVLVVAVITSTSTIVGALVSVLIGRSVGLGMRYLSGVLSERAHGEGLVVAIRRAGIDPISVIRMAGPSEVEHMRVENVRTDVPVGYTTVERPNLLQQALAAPSPDDGGASPSLASPAEPTPQPPPSRTTPPLW